MSDAAGSTGFLRSSRRLSAVGILLILAITAAAAVTVWDLRRDAISTYELDMTSLGLVFREQTARDLQAVDLVVQEVRDKVLTSASIDQFANLAGTEALSRALADRLRNLPQASAIGLVGADGHLLNTTTIWPTPAIDLSDRDYYQYFRDHDDDEAFISAPVENRVTGNWVIYLGHRINGPHHEFVGVLLGVMETRYFESFYKRITAYRSGSMTLLRKDGTILARYPHGDSIIGSKMAAESPWYELVKGAGGTYRSPGYLDGTVRIVSVHPLAEYPVVANVTVAEDEALADWRRQSIFIALGAGVVVIGFALLFRTLSRQVDRLEQQAAALARSGDALRCSEERSRDFAEATSDWFWEQDSALRFTWISQMSSLRGRLDAPNLGKQRWEITEYQVGDEQWAAHKADLAARRPFRDFRIEQTTDDGRHYHLSISGQPIFDAAGLFQGYRGTGRDITAQIFAEDQGRTLERQLHHAQRIESLGTLAGGIAHDLNNTLVPVVALAKVMLKQLPEGSVERSNLELIHRSGVQARDLVKQIMIFARQDTATKRVIDLADFIREALPLLRAAVPATVAMTYTAALSLPPVLADPSQAHQILLNLVTNAAQAIGDAPGSIAIDLVAAPQPGIGDGARPAACLTIRDSGPGMDSGTLARIFEPFFTTKPVGEGTGLGLAVVHGIVGNHGGRIEVQSQPGQGTRFTILLPCTEEEASQEMAEA